MKTFFNALLTAVIVVIAVGCDNDKTAGTPAANNAAPPADNPSAPVAASFSDIPAAAADSSTRYLSEEELARLTGGSKARFEIERYDLLNSVPETTPTFDAPPTVAVNSTRSAAERRTSSPRVNINLDGPELSDVFEPVFLYSTAAPLTPPIKAPRRPVGAVIEPEI